MSQDALTDREQEILACLVEGLSNHEIAARLHLAHRTVKWYNSQIYSKLGVSSREEAVEQAQALGLLPELLLDEAQVVVRHNLPTQITPFIGRRQELAEIADLLADPDLRLLTILAPGGMGKTRLGLAAAERQLRHFSDGVFFVPLAPLSSPDDIVTAIADSIGLSFYGSDPPKQQLLDYFRERKALLVLDNFEHLLDGAPLVTDILQAAPYLKVLATSREKLNLGGETIFTLSGLNFPTWETPEDALEYDAVKLFMQSAHRVRPDFELQAADLDYLARICRLTAGMPLGVVLAAGWLDVMSLEQIAAEIQQGIDILETEQRDVPERQRSVRATFSYSWARLNEAEQNVFMKLSVFRGGFTSGAAQVVAGTDMRILRRLSSKALVQAQPTGRYEVHELLRQYAEEKLFESGEAEAVQQAHSAYYMDFLAARDEDIKGRRQQAGLREIQTNFENIRRAWFWATDQRQYEAISRGVDCLVNFGEMKLNALEVSMILQYMVDTIAHPDGQTPHRVWDQVRVRLERIKYMLGNEIEARPVRDILERVRTLGDDEEIAYCLWMLGDYAHVHGDYELHKAYHTECMTLRQKQGDPFYIAHMHMGLMAAYHREHDLEREIASVHESIRIRRETNDDSNLCFSLAALGFQLLLLAQCREAEGYLDEALQVRQRMGETRGFVFVLAAKAALAFWRGQIEAAEQLEAIQKTAEGRDYFLFRQINLAITGWIVDIREDYQRGLDLFQQLSSNQLIDFEIPFIEWGRALAYCGLGNDVPARQAVAAVLRCAHRDYLSLTFQWVSLPLAAFLLARAYKVERAAELLGLAHTAPEDLMGWIGHWPVFAEMYNALERELGPEAYAAAWERGAQLELETVVEELLATLADAEGE